MTKKRTEYHKEMDPQTETAFLEETTDRTAELENKLGEYKDQLLRLAAEFDNYRKRSRADAALWAWQQKKDLLLSLLPVHDALERAIASIKEPTMVEGLNLIAKQFMTALESAGLAAIDVEVGNDFNPQLHEAMVNVATSEMPAGCVAMVVEKGYLLDGKLLRPARVGVSCPLPSSDKDKEPT